MSIATGVLSAVFWGVVLLSILVFVHEGGHYLAARAFKVRVTEFYLGLPCRFRLFVKSKKRGTEFGVTPFLLGGYNRICGMEGTEDELLADAFAIVQREGRIEAEKVASELGVEVDRAYALLITLSDWSAVRPYYNPDLGEKPTQRDYPAAFETLRRDANLLTEYDYGHDFEGEGVTEAGAPRVLPNPADQLAEERSHTYLGCGFFKRLAILLAGPLVNVILAFVLVTGSFLSMEFQRPINQPVIGSVVEDSVAAQSGLRANDKVLEVNSVAVSNWEDTRDEIRTACAANEDFDLRIERDGQARTVRVDLPEDKPVEVIGVNPTYEAYRLTLGESIVSAFRYAATVAKTCAQLIVPTQTMKVLDQSSSIVGISVMASEVVSKGLFDVLAFMAAISMSLGFMNLLPIPPLDGGKIVSEVIEALIGRSLSQKARLWISYVGLAFFAFVFVVVVKNDIVRLIFT